MRRAPRFGVGSTTGPALGPEEVGPEEVGPEDVGPEEVWPGEVEPRVSGLRTPSLRRRVTVVVVALVAVVLVVLVVASDVALRERLDAQLRDRLVDRAVVADALEGQVEDRDLARRLEGQGVSVVLVTSDGQTYTDGPLATSDVGPPAQGDRSAGAGASGAPSGAPPKSPGSLPTPPGGPASPPGVQATVRQSGHLLSVSHELSDGSKLLLLADAGDVDDTVAQVRIVLLLASGGVLLLAAALVPLVVGGTLRPLDTITAVARSITRGDRAKRLRPDHPGTDLGRTATAFDEMLDEVVGAERRAVASEARLRDFLFDAAHELRTPVAGIQASAEHLLRDDPGRAERQAALVTLIRETRRAGRLIDGLLLMARIDRGLDLAHDRIDLHGVAVEVVTARRHRFPGVELSVTPPPTGATAYVVGDRDRLVQVVANLVDNAAQAVGTDGVVDVGLAVTGGPRPEERGGSDEPGEADGPGESGDRVRLDVTDNGPGVPVADRERVFERLVRLDHSRAHPGSGLGLSIARGIARAHHGNLICLAPVSGPGAILRLTLPVSPPPPSPGPGVAPPTAANGPD